MHIAKERKFTLSNLRVLNRGFIRQSMKLSTAISRAVLNLVLISTKDPS